jgi:ParB-like chromosome segregation protein Spo0J
MQQELKSLAVADLLPSKTHAKIYEPRNLEILAESMRKYSQLQPIVVNSKNTIISGMSRWMAAKD